VIYDQMSWRDGARLSPRDLPSSAARRDGILLRRIVVMAQDQGIDVDQKGEQQPKDKERAQTAGTTENGKMPPQKVEENDCPQK
jgi:hypothetical protein